MAVAPMVEPDGGSGGGEGEVRKDGGGAGAGLIDGGQQGETAAGQHDHSAAVVRMGTDDKHKPEIVFVVKVCRIGGMKENHMRWWFETKSASIRRQILHG
jgi:hypothetical protein